MTSIALTCALLSMLTPGEKGLEVMRRMASALAPAEAIGLTMEYELAGEGRRIRCEIRAKREPMGYWCKSVDNDGLIEYARLEGMTITFTDDNGKRTAQDVPSPRVIVNEASARGSFSWRYLLDRTRYSALTAENCFFVHEEEVDGRMCDLVGSVRSSNGQELVSTVTYFWVEQETRLPLVYQLHTLLRGKSEIGPKYRLLDLNLNPDWASGPYPEIPEHVPAVKTPAKSVPSTLEWRQGVPLPEVALETLELKSVRLSELVAGTQTLLTFWATWCGPCQGELETLRTLDKVKSGELNVIAIGMFDSKSNLRNFAKKQAWPFKVLIDPDSEQSTSALARSFGVSAIPHAFLFDKHGKLLRHWVGFESKEGLTRHLKDRPSSFDLSLTSH